MQPKDRFQEAKENLLKDREKIFEAAQQHGLKVKAAKERVQDAQMECAGEEAQYRVIQDNLRDLNAKIELLESIMK